MRLIDADALKIDYYRVHTTTNSPVDYYVSKDQIDSAPTIEAEPVRQDAQWIPVTVRLPKTVKAVNVTWVNWNPPSYYERIKGVPQTGTAHYCNGRWWWESPCCEDYLGEYGYSTGDEIDKDIDVMAWMPLPRPYCGAKMDEEA